MEYLDIIHTLPMPIFLISPEGVIQFHNRAFEQFLQIPKHQLEGKAVDDIFSDPMAQQIMNHCKAILSGHGPAAIDIAGSGDSGQVFTFDANPLSSRSAVVFSGNRPPVGRRGGMTIHYLDQTSHQLKNPLNPIIGLLGDVNGLVYHNIGKSGMDHVWEKPVCLNLTYPPPEQVNALLHTARTGNISRINTLLHQVEALGAAYRPFVHQIKRFAGQFEFSAVEQFLLNKVKPVDISQLDLKDR